MNPINKRTNETPLPNNDWGNEPTLEGSALSFRRPLESTSSSQQLAPPTAYSSDSKHSTIPTSSKQHQVFTSQHHTDQQQQHQVFTYQQQHQYRSSTSTRAALGFYFPAPSPEDFTLNSIIYQQSSTRFLLHQQQQQEEDFFSF